jgi:hypothetical protein
MSSDFLESIFQPFPNYRPLSNPKTGFPWCE